MTGKAWRTFVAVCAEMEDPSFELTVEEFSVFYAAFGRARIAGAPFDPGFVARVEELNREAMGGEEDGDHCEEEERCDVDDDDVIEEGVSPELRRLSQADVDAAAVKFGRESRTFKRAYASSRWARAKGIKTKSPAEPAHS